MLVEPMQTIELVALDFDAELIQDLARKSSGSKDGLVMSAVS